MDSNVSKKGATGTPVRKSRLPDLAGTGSARPWTPRGRESEVPGDMDRGQQVTGKRRVTSAFAPPDLRQEK